MTQKRGRKPRTDLPPDSIGARIRNVREGQGYTQQQLGKKINASHVTILKIETGESNPDDPRTKRTIIQIAQALNNHFDEEWLREHLPEPSVMRVSEHRQWDSKGVEVRVLGRVAAGKPIQPFPEEKIITVPADMIRRGREHFGLQVAGSSMSPQIMHGDIILLRPQPDPNNGQVVVLQLNGDEYTLKRWHRKGKKVTLKPENEEFDKIELVLGINEVECIGEYVGLIRIAK